MKYIYINNKIRKESDKGMLLVGQELFLRIMEGLKMAKKMLVLMMVGTLAILSLSGCGTSRLDIAATADVVAADSGAMADFHEEHLDEETETWAKTPNDMEGVPPIATEPALDEIMENVFKYAENVDMMAVYTNNIKDMYYAESSDALNIKLSNMGETAIVSIVPKGIIALSYAVPTSIGKYNWASTGTYKCTPFTVSLDCINPDTGEVQHLRTFSSEDTLSCSLAQNGLGRNAVLARMHFNSDFTQLTATLTLEDGSVHVGWIDESGKFTDVSAKVTVDAGDFGALTKHSNPCFGPGGYFYFRDSTNSNVQDKRVPLNNLTASAVETVVEDAKIFGNPPLHILPDGTVGEAENFWWYYYDKNMEYPAYRGDFSDWISPSECVGTDDGMIYKYTLSGDDDNLDSWYSDKTELVPNIKGRINGNPAVSPDGTKVAFLSELNDGTDRRPYLYIVPVAGGNPVKVSTNYMFDNFNVDFGGGFIRGDKKYCYNNILLMWE